MAKRTNDAIDKALGSEGTADAEESRDTSDTAEPEHRAVMRDMSDSASLPVRTARAVARAHDEDPYSSEDSKAGRKVLDDTADGDWTYRRYSDGSVRIMKAPQGSRAVGMLLTAQSPGHQRAYHAIMDYLGKADSQEAEDRASGVSKAITDASKSAAVDKLGDESQDTKPSAVSSAARDVVGSVSAPFEAGRAIGRDLANAAVRHEEPMSADELRDMISRAQRGEVPMSEVIASANRRGVVRSTTSTE